VKDEDMPRPEEVLQGWKFVKSGPAQIGDRYWRPHGRIWLPLIWSDKKHGVDVREKDMPVVIRKKG